MLGIFDNIRRLTYRVQPISQIQKRQNRKREQEQRQTYYETARYISQVRKDLGYSDGNEWSV